MKRRPSDFRSLLLEHDSARLAVRWYHADGKSTDSRAPIQSLVFVHGFAGDQDEGGLFPTLACSLAASGFHIFTYDCRGLGKSTGDYGATGIQEHVDDFIRVLQFAGATLGLPSSRIAALGFSLGAAVIGLAQRRATECGGLVYLCPATRPRISMWPRYNRAEVHECLKRDGYFSKPDNGVQLGRKILRDLSRIDLGVGCFDVAVPLLVCHGTQDARIPLEHTESCFAAMQSSRAELKRFEGASHSFKPSDQHWKTLAQTVGDWLCDGRKFENKRGRPERRMRARPTTSERSHLQA